MSWAIVEETQSENRHACRCPLGLAIHLARTVTSGKEFCLGCISKCEDM